LIIFADQLLINQTDEESGMAVKNKIVIQLFHPLLHKSRVNTELLRAVTGLEGVDIRILYDLYPDFDIDMKREQEVLLAHDVVVWQHPFYWYSAPSLLKEWIDIVLEHGFAYGREGKSLMGKRVMNAITAGGRREVYREGGLRKYTVSQLLAPFELTANLCNMEYLPPNVVHGTHLLEKEGIVRAGQDYRKFIIGLRDGTFDQEELGKMQYANDIIN
jgi:glutathione-regulated potassium-efflux system ancillary protein KefG